MVPVHCKPWPSLYAFRLALWRETSCWNNVEKNLDPISAFKFWFGSFLHGGPELGANNRSLHPRRWGQDPKAGWLDGHFTTVCFGLRFQSKQVKASTWIWWYWKTSGELCRPYIFDSICCLSASKDRVPVQPRLLSWNDGHFRQRVERPTGIWDYWSSDWRSLEVRCDWDQGWHALSSKGWEIETFMEHNCEAWKTTNCS